MRKYLLALAPALALATITFGLAVCAQAQNVTFIARFTGGQGSSTGVVQATDGNFYGAAGGGANGLGQVFRMTPTGELSTIYSFCSQPNCADGEYPGAAPILGADGALYGVTDGDSLGGSSTLYRVTLDGQLTTIYTFCGGSTCARDGIFPNGIIQASDGNFYGTMAVGGNHGGTIFRITPTGQFTVLHTFCSRTNCIDGANPYFPPIQGSDGNFYGTTYDGGKRGGGVVYELTASGTYEVLHNFCGQNETCESDPSTIVEDANGNLFGTTVYGISVVFEINSTHHYRILNTILGSPFVGLTLANDGNFYGLTQEGGTANEGTIFEVTPAGEFTSLFSFVNPEGYDPAPGPLFQGTDGNLYGGTLYGPPPCCYGTIFRLSNGFSRLVKTVPVAGKVGQDVLILGRGLIGSSSVTFNGVAAAFTVESDTYIKATVPAGATTGAVSVVTPSGTLNSNPQFVVTK
jgi:uncharacterized repeat protein (TIGR03803 family)